MPSKYTLCLWLDSTVLEAATFHARTFPHSTVHADYRAPCGYPTGVQSDVLTMAFSVAGLPCLGLNGGPAFRHGEALSFQIATGDRAETDGLCNAPVANSGQKSHCGWRRDRWGLSRQIIPRVLRATITGPAAARHALEAMMQMTRIDIAAIGAARRG